MEPIVTLGDKSKTPPKPENKVIEIDSSKIPVLDDYSINHFKRIVKTDKRLLEFEDDLTIFSLAGNAIGQFTISVTPVIFKNQSCFRIKAKSVGTLDDIPCGTEINAIVNDHLETLEQDHFEYIKLSPAKIERKTLMSIENDDFVINQVENNQDEIKSATYKIKRSLMYGFISESANLLLQRLMVQFNLIDSFSLFTLDKDMNPCFVTYKPLDNRKITIDDDDFKVTGLERTIESLGDLPVTWQIYFLHDGHMVNRVQVGYPAVMRSVRKPKPIEIDEYLPKVIIEKKPLDWEKDMELRSKYLDKKERLKNDFAQYSHDQPDLKALMADYLQSLLTFKPDDVVAFSAKFFAPYSSKTASNRLLPTLKHHVNIPRHVI